MTEHEWLACDDPARMLSWATGHAGRHTPLRNRGLRLWCASLWDMSRNNYQSTHMIVNWRDGSKGINEVSDEPWVMALAWANPEQDNEGDPPMALRAALLRDIVGNPWREAALLPCWLTPTVLTLAQAAYEERGRAMCTVCRGYGTRYPYILHAGGKPGPAEKCHVCRGTGRTGDGAIDPVRLTILADALEEAGCTTEEVLAHLRSPGPHVRGCWALDLVLGKE